MSDRARPDLTAKAPALTCPACGTALPPPRSRVAEVVELSCPQCGATVRLRRREGNSGEVPVSAAAVAVLSGGALAARLLALDLVEGLYRAGTCAGATVMLPLGGFVLVLGRWLRDEVTSPGDILVALGGVKIGRRHSDADTDLGPLLARADAPALFDDLASLCRKVGARVPAEVRLTYLPCCLATAWGRRSALAIGLPLLHVLDRAEMRAVLAHELAHLARGDATRSARRGWFVEHLGQALDEAPRSSPSPLRLWARLCRHWGEGLLAPVALSQEVRADRAAAAIVGGPTAASALVKVALVQPLFREALEHYDSASPAFANFYAFFRAFWCSLPETLMTEMRHGLLASAQARRDHSNTHPALLDRLSVTQAYPERPHSTDDALPAATMLGDVETLEQMLHNRLFSTSAVAPTVFHRAGS